MTNLKELKYSHSIFIYDEMEIVSRHGKSMYLRLNTPASGRYYAVSPSVIYFCDNGWEFVTPYNRGAKTLLEAEGFLKINGFPNRNWSVPFSGGEYPKDEVQKERWERIIVANYRILAEEFREDCEAYCDKKRFARPLPDQVLAQCYNVPKDGVRINWYGDEVTLHPAISGIFVDSVVRSRLGRFSVSNDKVAFVYRDGRTFIAKGSWIIPYLRQADYSNGSLAVAFANGEEIIDPVQKRIWDAVPELDKFEI